MNSSQNAFSGETARADGRLRQAQLKMLDMLTAIDKLCQEHQIDYWLDAGTLLGAVRHKGFIPWDDDMDIGMPRESYEKFLKIAPKCLPSHIWLQTMETDPGFFNMATPLKIRDKNSRYIEKHEQGNETYQQGIFIDVFVYDKLPEDNQQRKKAKFLAKKLARLLSAKYSSVKMGHYAGLYKAVAFFIPKSFLQKKLNRLIEKSKHLNSTYWGRGYQCVGKNYLNINEIYPLKRILFENGEFNIIHQEKAILMQQYGEDYLVEPPLEAQLIRHCKELIPEI